MKKLIALINVIAVMATMSLTSFAEITVTPDAATAGASLAKAEGETSGYVASYESDEVNTQTTILAVKGETITTSSIQYINQFSDDSETAISFDLRDTLAAGETVTVYIGGDKISKQTIGTITNTEAPTPTTYTITFKYNDVVDTKTYEEGADIEVPAAPTKEADENNTYSFAGWYDETDGEQTTVNLTDAKATKDVTYVAKFDATAKATITFIVDGTTYDEAKYAIGATIVVPEEPTKEGFTFKFWGATADATEAADLGATVSGDATFYAIWQENQSGGEETQYNFTVNTGITGNPYGVENGKIIRVAGLTATDVVTVTVDDTAHTAKYYTTTAGEIIHIATLVSATEITNDMISHTTGTPEVIKFGDTDLNGTPATKDASDLNRALVGAVLRGKTYSLPTDLYELLMCDTDGNGVIATKDASDLNRSLVGAVLRGKTYSLDTMGIYSIK